MTIKNLTPGGELHGWTVEHIDPITILNAKMIRLRHRKTGARFMHLYREDDNHLFAVGFRTPPEDSSGVAHILEHTALCGSRNFPVRDPFFSMLKRSLNTFMNAMTASDWTLYPFSSQNLKDFDNLLQIYLDAAFFPLLRERDFHQEGHRLEFTVPDDPDSPLLYKGVVYNEMKGAMSDPSSLLSRRMGRHLFPTTTYGHNSGGEPSEIPELSWQQLRDFHARYYHPSNAWFFSYGTLDLEDLLATIEERVLKHFKSLQLDSEVPPEQRLDQPRQVVEGYPLDAGEPLEKRSMVQIGWLCGDINDSFERLAMSLLSSLLLGNPAAPLYKALLDSGLGGNLAPGSGYHDDYRTTFFAAGLQGTDPENQASIENLILETLEKVAREGFAPERIDAALHRLEFANREVSGDSYPYALLLLMRLLGPWIHDGDPLGALDFEVNLQRLRQEVATGGFFEGLIRRRLLDNPHRINLLLKPDTEIGPKQEAAVRQTLDQVQQQLSEKEKQRLVTLAEELKQAQEAPEDLSCLPSLELSDIEPLEKPVRVQKGALKEVASYWFDQPTNGIGVVALNFGLDGLEEGLLPYLPVFCSLLTQIGAGGRDYLGMAQELEAVTGGVTARTSLLDDPQSLEGFSSSFEIKGKALLRNLEPMLTLVGDLLASPDFSDLQRLNTVLGQLKVSLENSIPQSGHTYAARTAAACLTPVGRRREQWSGLEQVALVRQLAAVPVEQLGELAERLQRIARQLFCRSHLQVAVTVEGDQFKSIRGPLEELIGALPEQNACVAAKMPTPLAEQRLGWIWSLPVNYVTRVFRAVPYCHSDSAPLTVLAKLLRSEFLHREIREKGGAYGGQANYNSETGLLSLLSYRDPQLVRTLNVYDQAIDWVISGDFKNQAVKEAILGVFGDLDKPLSPAGFGAQEFANLRQGLTLEMRNLMRRRLLSVDRQALCRVAETYLKNGQSAVAVLAGENALQQANTQLGDRALVVKKI